MATRLKGDIGEIFGIDYDPKGGRRMTAKEEKDLISKARRSTRGFFGRAWLTFQDWEPGTKKAALIGSAGTVGALVLGILVGRKFAGPDTAKVAPAPPSPASATAHAGATLTVKTKGNVAGMLRSAAGKASNAVAQVPAGTSVTVLDSAMGDKPPKRWYQVQLADGRSGWMHSDILTGAT